MIPLDYQIVAAVVAAVSIVMAILVSVMHRKRSDRYDDELRKMHLDVMRHALEMKAYEANDALLSDPVRWRNVNHLLLEGLQRNGRSGQEGRSSINTSFFESSGIVPNEVVELKRRVFVLTPLNNRFDDTYEVIKGTCTNLGLECVRGDEEFHPGAVLSHILKMMLESSLVIVNIDGRNPNVYYELGIAHAIGKRTLLVASAIEDLPFDIQSQRIIIHKSKQDLRRQLTAWLGRIYVES